MNTSPVDTLKAALAKLERDGDEHGVCGDIRAAIAGLTPVCTGSHCDDTLLWGEHDTDCALYTTPRAVGDGMADVRCIYDKLLRGRENRRLGSTSSEYGDADFFSDLRKMLSAAPSEGSAPINYQSADSRLIVEGGAQGAFAVPQLPGNWPEDASHENGDYECNCVGCGNTFYGHKRRVVCKQCASTGQVPEVAEPKCESGDPACGPAGYEDDDGVLLCRQCYESLETETRTQRRARELGIEVVATPPASSQGDSP